MASSSGKSPENKQNTLRFGIWTPPWAIGTEMVKCWQYIESLGYDSLWTTDNFVNPIVPNSPWFEAWTSLAALAACTNRIRIGTMVTDFIYRNPAVFAKQVLTVDHISQGRLELGIGSGNTESDFHEMVGITVWSNAERVERFREVVEILDQMLRNNITTYKGKYYQIKEAIMCPAPLQQPRPPITIGAHGPKMIRVAAALSDSWNTSGVIAETSQDAFMRLRQCNELVSQFASELGRDPGTIKRSFCVYYTPDKPLSSMEAFYDFVGRYHEAGFNEFLFGYWTEPDPRFDIIPHISSEKLLERFAKEAIPTLKQSN